MIKENGNNNGNSGLALWFRVSVVIIGSLIAVLSAVHLYNLSDIKSELRYNRDDFYKKMDRVIALYEKENSKVLTSLADVCRTLAVHSEAIKEHDTMLRLPYKARKDVYHDSVKVKP